MDDSFDLFGGLPTVGGGGGGAADDDSVPAKTIEASQTKDSTTTNNTSKNYSNDQPVIKPSAADSTTAVGVVKSEVLEDKPKESASSLVSSIGTSGTKLVSLRKYNVDNVIC